MTSVTFPQSGFKGNQTRQQIRRLCEPVGMCLSSRKVVICTRRHYSDPFELSDLWTAGRLSEAGGGAWQSANLKDRRDSRINSKTWLHLTNRSDVGGAVRWCSDCPIKHSYLPL